MIEIPFTGERFVPTEKGRIAYEHYHRYAACIDAAKGKVVLDVASGEGYGSALLAGTAREVIGLDVDATTVRVAREKYRAVGNLSFAVGDCRRVPLADKSVDLIVSFETIEHIAEHEALVLEFVRLLRPDGGLIVSSPNKEIYSEKANFKNEFHARELTHQEFVELFREHFQSVRVYGQRLAIASFLLGEKESEGEPLKSFMKGERGASPGFQSIPDATYSVAICAQRDDALPAFDSSIHLDPGYDLFAEQERVLRWASLLHREHEDIKSELGILREAANAERSNTKALLVAFESLSAELAEAEDVATESRQRATGLESALRLAEKYVTELEDAIDAANELGHVGEQRRIDNFASTISFSRRMAAQSAAKNRFLARRPTLATSLSEWLTRTSRRSLARRIDIIRRSGVFDIGHYLSANPVLEATGGDPLLHYALIGWREGRDPSPFFSVAWYLEKYGDIAKAGIEPLSHYLELGAAEGRDPHPLFSGKWYLERYRDVVADGVAPLVHFVREGAAQHRDPHPLFDSEWYVANNPDVATAELSPFLHYILRGASEGRDPHPLFNVDWYKGRLPQPIGSGEDPLRHYLQHGFEQRSDPHPLFNARWYAARNPDAAHTGLTPLVHFLQYGLAEQRDNPHPLFSTRWYLATYPDVAALRVNPLVHYVRFGARELRSPHPMFDARWYVENNRISPRRSENPLIHYLDVGASQGLSPHPLFSSDWYVRNNPDPDQPIVHPLVHYVAVGIFSGAAPNPDMTRQHCERLLAHVRKGTFWTTPPAELLERVQPWDVTPALEQVLTVLGSANAASAISELYKFLGEHEHGPIKDADLAEMPELSAEVGELSRLSHALVSTGRLDATVVIPVYNQIAYTLCCLRALLASPARSRFEIIVADDLSDDATAMLVGQIGGIVRHHRGATNLGFTRNCNAAAVLAGGEAIVFLNNDTIPLPGWLDELVDTLRADASIGLVGSRLLNSDGTLQEAGGILWQDGSAWNFGRGQNAVAPAFSYVKDVDYLSGAAIAVRKSVWTELGGFDETFVPAYCEDSDLAFRIRRHGLRTVYQPFSTVIHHEGVSHGRDLSTGIKAYQVQNNKIFFERWKQVLARENLPHGHDVMLARDRSRGRTHILVIDHYIPQPDRDAGSRTISQYLMLLQANGLQVTFWPQNRHFDHTYAAPLQRQGIEVRYDVSGHVMSLDQWLDENHRYPKYVLLSRAGVAFEFIGKIRERTAAKILLYGHDVHFRRLEMEFAVTGNPATREEKKGFEAIEREVWSHCDVIYYPSEDERAFVASEIPGKIVRAVPPFIYGADRLRLMRARLEQDKLPRTRQLMFIGGYRHRPNVDAMLWFTSEIWPRVQAADPGACLCIAGSFPPPEIEALSGPNIVVTGAISDETLRQIYLATQVVIVPLRFGAGVKGKVMEAASYARPIISTSVGVQGLAGAESFVTVRDSAEEFADAVIAALSDPDAQVRNALIGLDFVAATASEDAARRVFAADIPELDKARR